MKEDKTPTGAARRKKPNTHKRLRLEKAKELKAKGVLKKKERAKKKEDKAKDGEGAKEVDPTTSRLPQLKKNSLTKPPKPPARFRKRQVHKSWLPTHVWHAKRAHMTEPQHPLWRFAIPLSPNEKVFRTTHRAATMRGCVVWDMSYMSTIGLEGVEASLLNLMRGLGVPEAMLTGQKGAKWRRGRRGHTCWIRDRDKQNILIAPVMMVWCAVDEDIERSMNEQQLKKRKRKLLFRVHPSAFFQAWAEILKVAKMQRPQVLVEDLRFEVGSIEITGAGSTEALIAALRPTDIALQKSSDEVNSRDAPVSDASVSDQPEDGWEDFETPQKVWTKLAGLTNPSALPADAVLAFNARDPRLRHPARTISIPSSTQAADNLLHLLADWPPDSNQSPADIFDRTKRLVACRRLASQKAINRRKSLLVPGDHPPDLPTDPSIPILLYASRQAPNASTQGRWTLLLPWDCVLPVWYTLVHYPLSTGGTPRFGCLAQQQQIALKSPGLHFPSDFPGTKAGWEWELKEREVARLEWTRKPRGRRPEFGSLKLGNTDPKGEIGEGWACDWERLVLGKENNQKGKEIQQQSKEGGKETGKKSKKLGSASEEVSPQTESSATPDPPHGIHQLLQSPQYPTPLPRAALSPIHLTFAHGGHPHRRARIYRIPNTSPEVSQKWHSLITNGASRSKKGGEKAKWPTTPKNAPRAEQVKALANSLFRPPPLPQHQGQMGAPKPDSPEYPPTPCEADLVGFITSANYNLGRGRCAAVGNVILARLVEMPAAAAAAQSEGEGQRNASGDDGSKQRGAKGQGKRKKTKTEGWVIVRDVGQTVCRVAKWELAMP